MISLIIVLSIYVLVILVGGGLVWYREKQRYREELLHEHTVLEIIISKNVEEEQRGPLAAEQVFSNLHSIYRETFVANRWFGDVQPRMSIEIVHMGNLVHFYAWVRSDLKELFESQVYAQYPDVEIYERKEHCSLFQDKKYLISSTLALREPYVYPIKKYKQFEDIIAKKTYDSLAGMASSLSKMIDPNDVAMVQIVFSPITDDWHKKGLKDINFITRVFGIKKIKDLWLQFRIHHSWIVKIATVFIFPLVLLWLVVQVFIPKDREALEELDRLRRGEEIRDDTVKNSLLGKIAKLAFLVGIRVTYATDVEDRKKAENKIKEIGGSFKQFNLPHLNGFEIKTIHHNKHFILEKCFSRKIDIPCVLNSEELASVFHLPISTLEIPNIQIITSKTLSPPLKLPFYTGDDTVVTPLGETNFRNNRKPFGIKNDDRRRHMYVIGKTGMGKSTLLENMIYSDIRSGKGVAIIDPHGDLADKTLTFVPKNRINDVILFDPSDTSFPLSFNMLENINPEHRSLIASGLVGVFKKLYAESWGPRLEYILRNTILSLLEYPNSTMLGIMRILTDTDFRTKVVNRITDPVVKAFWLSEYNKMQDRQRTEAISPIQNKVGQFLSSTIIRNIVGQPISSINMRWAMDHRKIVVVNLSKGKIGEDNSALLGSMMITKFQLDAMSRADIPEKERIDFYLFVDEFQNFATSAFATILSEARKYRLSLTIANQYIAQMPEDVRDSVFGNVGSLVSFQVGYDDADYLQSQFNEEVTPNDLLQLPRGSVYTKLLVDNMPTTMFSANTYPPVHVDGGEEVREKVIKVSRERYGKKKEVVEEKIKRWADTIGLTEEKQVSDKTREKKEPKKETG